MGAIELDLGPSSLDHVYLSSRVPLEVVSVIFERKLSSVQALRKSRDTSNFSTRRTPHYTFNQYCTVYATTGPRTRTASLKTSTGLFLRTSPLQHTPNDPSSMLTLVLVLAPTRRRPPTNIPLRPIVLPAQHLTLRRLHKHEPRGARRPKERIQRVPPGMQARDEMRARRGRPGEHRADRAELRGVLRRVPERVCGEEDVGCGALGQERGRVGAPGVRDDGAVRSGVVARYVLAERADELGVGKVAGDDADMGIALGDEDAG